MLTAERESEDLSLPSSPIFQDSPEYFWHMGIHSKDALLSREREKKREREREREKERERERERKMLEHENRKG